MTFCATALICVEGMRLPATGRPVKRSLSVMPSALKSPLFIASVGTVLVMVVCRGKRNDSQVKKKNVRFLPL